MATWNETLGSFHARAIVILAAIRMKWIRIRSYFEILGIFWFNSAIIGVCGIANPVTLRIKLKILFQYPLIRGHSQKICKRVPKCPHSLKHVGEEFG